MSDYAGPVLGAVGAVVGWFVGGPVGASWGWAIGSTLGGAYSASQQVIPGPKIGDVQQQTSQEGGFRPIIFGRSHPIKGNVIADSDPRIVKKRERQGKGGPKVETEYAYRTYAVGFCEGEASLLQVWRNGILVYDVEDPSMSAENSKFLEYAKWHTGTFDQMPDPDLQAIYGAGNTPFFRGTAYLVLASEDVTDQRGAWSQWQVRVFRGAAKRVTTTPYPVEIVEAFEPRLSTSRGQLYSIPIEEFSVSIDIVSGILRQPVIDYAAEPEAYVPDASIISGVLDSILVTYSAPPVEYSPTVALQSGVLDQIVVTYSAPPDEYQQSITILSGSLT